MTWTRFEAMYGSTHLLEMARGAMDLPAGYTITALRHQTREWLRAHESYHAPEAILEELEGLDEEISSLLRAPLGFLYHEHPQWGQHTSFRESAYARRVELLTELAMTHLRSSERRHRALTLVLDQVDFFMGWELLCQAASVYQLGEDRPWWRPGHFVESERLRRELRGNKKALEESGFTRVPREVYLERVRIPIIRLMLVTRQDCMADVASIIAMYTASRQERKGIEQLTEDLRQTLHLSVLSRLERQGSAIPMKPLYSLPRESHNLSAFFVSRKREALQVDAAKKVIRGELGHARVKVAEDREGQQQLLFFDSELVNKESGSGDAFISIRLEEKQSAALDALMKGIEQLDIDPNVLEHLPRITAGIFAAAQRDRKQKFSWPGTFWDTAAGARLCRIIGFDPENKRHRKRIQDARKILETIILHREVRGRDNSGKKVTMTWSGPLLEARKGELKLKMEDREGMSEQHRYQSWSIARELWEMVEPEMGGGTPAFMILDQRAFQLSDRSSRPFNIYWTLVNRAYMGAYTKIEEDRVQPNGKFSPRIGTIYNWAGLEGKERPYRIKQYLREALEAMVVHGLLESWRCEELEAKRGGSLEDLKMARLHVVFSADQLTSFQMALTDEQPSES